MQVNPRLFWILLVLCPCLTSGRARADGLADLLPTDDQSAERGAKRFTVGVPLANPYNFPGQLQLRIGDSFLIGTSYDANLDQPNGNLDDGYSLHATPQSASFYVEYYPLKKSGFHLGIGAEERWGSYTVTKAVPGQDDATTICSGTFAATYGGPSFGWTWLWHNGITFGFDVSERKRFTTQFASTAMALGAPDSLLGKVRDQVMPDAVMGSWMLGYSF